MANKKNTIVRWIALALVLVLTSMSLVMAGSPKTEITLEIFDGSNFGDFKEIGFYNIENGNLVRTPIVSAVELRHINGPKTYTVDGHFSTSRMYVLGSNWGHDQYFYTEKQYNADGKVHFTTNGVYFWFEHKTDPYTGQCEFFNDYGFKLINIKTYLEKTECSDNYDNDYDGLIDEDDPGCWDNPLYPSSYNPDRDDESRYTISCYTDYECGTPSITDQICQQGNVFDVKTTYTCENPGTGVSQCAQSTTTEFKLYCPLGCTDGSCNVQTDTTGPAVVITDPENNDEVYKEVTIKYIPTDESDILACELQLNGNQVLTNAAITNNTINIFEVNLSQEGYHTAQVNCYDEFNNKGQSNTVTFFYGENTPQCEEDNQCGAPSKEYFCDGSDLMKTTITPVCLIDGTCDTDTSTSFVRTCNGGCSNGICKGTSGNNNDYSDDTNNIPIIQTGCPKGICPKSYENNSIEVVYVEDNSTNEVEQKSFNWYGLLLLLLIISIIILLILIILVSQEKETKTTVQEHQYYSSPETVNQN